MNPLPKTADFQQYRVPAVRHLAWMCRAPALLDGGTRFQPAHYLSDDLATILKRWDQAPEQGPAVLTEPAPRRLGHYFERLYACLLADLLGWQILLRNHPVRNNGMTLGELDFILRNPVDGTVEHHEVAVKFYLGYDHADHRSPLWYGPNSRDRLDLKSAHLLTRQCRLTKKPEARTVLNSLGIPMPDRARVFMPGYLFYPVGQTLQPPPDVPSDHLRGQWIFSGNVAAFRNTNLRPEAGNERWVPLVKPYWLGPWHQNHEPEGPPAEAALRMVQEAGIPGLFALLRQCPRTGTWAEHSRLFVVPDHWPAQQASPNPQPVTR